MVHANVNGSMTKGHYADGKKPSDQRLSGYYQQQQQQQQQQRQSNKDSKYGSWGPVFKNKQNFIDMHIG